MPHGRQAGRPCSPLSNGLRDVQGERQTAHRHPGARQTALPKPRHGRELLPLGRVRPVGTSSRVSTPLCPQGLQDATRTQNELGSAGKRSLLHASLLKQTKLERVASPCPRRADGAQEKPPGAAPQDPPQSLRLAALTSLASAAAAGRITPRGALQKKGQAQHRRNSWPPWPSAAPLPCRGQLTFVFEVLQDGDDGLQGNAVGEEELPSAVLLKGLPVQALN